MKLMIVIVHDTDSDAVLQALLRQGFRVTRVASTGGFLRRGNVTLLIGVEVEKVETVIGILRQTTRPVEQAQHRATIFVVDMPYFEQI
jgi:uncharacterized protein YaaQ